MSNKIQKLEFGVKGLIIKNNQYLAVHKVGIIDDKYELPGGRMQFGETIEQTLIREIQEELNILIEPIKLIDTWNYINENNTNQVTGVIYLCKIIDNEAIIKLSDEHTDYKWFPFNDVSKMNILFNKQMQTWDWKKL
jgi:ADP-ribose pyrophosphatase